MDTKIVTIELDTRSYDIYIGKGLLFRLNDFLPDEIEGRSFFVVTDRNVQSYAQQIRNLLAQEGAGRAELFVLPPGEKTKSFEQVTAVSQWLLSNGLNRDSVVLAVGGGVIGDLAGFCASIAMRGVSYVQVPTSLLAQVDSSVGGKTGINTPQGKNLVGSFYQPSAVIADIETLQTLPERQLLAGYAEIVKYGLIGDLGFFEWLEENGERVCTLDEEALAHAIEVSVRAKAALVRADEREAGRRALLNLGHTFGHALEAAAGYDGRLLHGEGVAIGTIMAFDLSVRMGLCPQADRERVEAHFQSLGLPVSVAFIEGLNTSVDKLLEIMRRDKKARSGKMVFILSEGIGRAFVHSEVPEDLVRETLRDALGGEAIGGGRHSSLQGIKERWKSAFSSHS